MGYFSNGTEGELYYEAYCAHCIHDEHDDCAVLAAHFFYNYDECNKSESILHMLIPRAKDGENEQCKMFIPSTFSARRAKEEV
jgi:hypothetical protein